MEGELGEETDVDVGVCVGGAVARLEGGMKGSGGIRAIARGMADDDDPCGGCSSGILRERLTAIHRDSAGKEGTCE